MTSGRVGSFIHSKDRDASRCEIHASFWGRPTLDLNLLYLGVPTQCTRSSRRISPGTTNNNRFGRPLALHRTRRRGNPPQKLPSSFLSVNSEARSTVSPQRRKYKAATCTILLSKDRSQAQIKFNFNLAS